MSADWEAALERRREGKTGSFGSSPNAPIPAGERDSFGGPSYYPPDPDYRFELPLHEHDERERVTVATSADGEREYVSRGGFRFEVGGEAVTLRAYKSDPDQDRLWVPFRDATSGDETYGAGRYLDLEPDPHRTDGGAAGEANGATSGSERDERTDGGEWALDFNEAYSPACAYAGAYECPLPPADNWLGVEIRAGERSYEGPDPDATAPF